MITIEPNCVIMSKVFRVAAGGVGSPPSLTLQMSPNVAKNVTSEFHPNARFMRTSTCVAMSFVWVALAANVCVRVYSDKYVASE